MSALRTCSSLVSTHLVHRYLVGITEDGVITVRLSDSSVRLIAMVAARMVVQQGRWDTYPNVSEKKRQHHLDQWTTDHATDDSTEGGMEGRCLCLVVPWRADAVEPMMDLY